VDVEQVSADQQRASAVDVDVRVIESGGSERSFQVNRARGRTRMRAHIGITADSDDLRAAHCDRLGPRLRRVHCVDAAVDKEQVGRSFALLRDDDRGDTRETKSDRNARCVHARAPSLRGFPAA
jgi:hypothetical protein